MNAIAHLNSPFSLSLVGLVLCALMMTAAWGWAISRRFLSIVDAIWAFGIGFLAVFYGALSGSAKPEKTLPLAVVAFWSIRLGSHLASRLMRHFPREDKRYDELRARWQKRLKWKSFLLFQFQALTQCFFAFPFACVAASNREGSLALWAGIALAVVGLAGEATADSQLSRFIADLSHRGKVCDVGLWRYSRHPNYFFEWVVWLGFGVVGASAGNSTPQKLLCAGCPLLMLILLLFVTGVPPAEASSLKSKGQVYRDYQARTSKFVPWCPKTQTHSQEVA